MTGEWTYGIAGGTVSPVLAVNPSAVLAYPGAAFTPSPVFTPFLLPPAKKKDETKKDDNKKDNDQKKKVTGWWEQMYDEDGDRFWKHTVSQKTTYEDPYF